ncbi:MAG: DUF1992 domain-containing protein, partial [Chthoniobacter sp.]
MNWTKLAESRIEEAIAQGEFRDLPCQGQPLDLAEYFAQPPAERAGSALLKNAHVIPPEVQLLKEIGELEKAILEAESPPSYSSHSSPPSHPRNLPTRLREQLQEKRVAFAMAMERRHRRDPRSPD